MSKKSFWLSLPLCMVIALLAAFLFVSPAFAQDETPPQVVPTESPAEALPAEAVPTEVAPGEVLPIEAAPAEVLPTEAAPAEELPVEAALLEAAPAVQPSLAETLDDAGVALTGAMGEPLPLVTRSTETIVNTADPYFFVGSVKYQFLKSTGTCPAGTLDTTCFISLADTPIMDSLKFMKDKNLTPTDRKLYIEPGTYNEHVDFIGSWNGVKGLIEAKGVTLAGEDAAAGDVIINGIVEIYNFVTNFTLSNISVRNDGSAVGDYYEAITAHTNTGTLKLSNVEATSTATASAGIFISQNGSVILDRVNASGNTYSGAYIENFGTGPITVINSTFDDNQGNGPNGIMDCRFAGLDYGCSGVDSLPVGLMIGYSAGPVNIFGVSASFNNGDGVKIFGKNTITVKDSVFDGNKDYSGDPNNGISGMGLYADGNVLSLENIQANNNDENGVRVYGQTSVTGTHLHTDGNYWSGVSVDTCWDDGVKCTNTGAGTVTIKNSSSSNNGKRGFVVFAKGATTVSSVYIGGNEEDGILIDNTFSPSAPAVTITDVEVSGGRDDGGGWYQATENGINLNIKGAATLKDVYVYDNSLDGIHVVSSGTGAVTITQASNFFNESRNNGQFGYFIDTKGPVTITNLDSHDNGYWGGVIHNENAASAAAVTVNLLGTSEYMNGYWGNSLGGLYIKSRGVVTVSRVWIP